MSDPSVPGRRRVRNFEKAVEYLERSLPLRSDVVERFGNLTALAEAYRHLGRMDDAEEMHLRALGKAEEAFGPDHPRTAYPLMGLGKICAVTGRRRQAEAYYARCVEIFTANDDRDWYFQLSHAGHLALMGDHAAAMAALRQSVSQGCPSLILEREPDLDSLRGMAEFRALKSTSTRAL